MSHTLWAMQLRCVDLRVTVLLNGYPVFMPPDTGGRTAGHKVNPWIIEGTNVLEVRLGRTTDRATLLPDAQFELYLYRTHKEQPVGDEAAIERFAWNADEHPLEDDGMTTVLRSEFDVPAAHAFGPWAWQTARPFDPGERVAIELLVGKCRQALVHRNADELLALLDTKFSEMAHALGFAPALGAQSMREHLQPYFDADALVVDAIDYGVVALIPVADQRIVLVMGPKGAPVLQAHIPPTDDGEPPRQPLAINLAVSNLAGTWTVVR